MKIYTKTGDDGETGLLGGVRVEKSHLAIEVCGCLDEANSAIGIAVANDRENSDCSRLEQIQNDLFDLGSRVADCLNPSERPAEFGEQNVEKLEAWIDEIQQKLPALKEFILPGGCPAGAQLHFARTVCRRAERRLVELSKTGTERDLSIELKYLNRLGDLLFVLARSANQQNGVQETAWKVSR